MNKLESIFKSFILDNNINIKARFLIAVSGGADSMTCLFIANKLGIKIGAAHVNYMLRDKESENETSLLELTIWYIQSVKAFLYLPVHLVFYCFLLIITFCK